MSEEVEMEFFTDRDWYGLLVDGLLVAIRPDHAGVAPDLFDFRMPISSNRNYAVIRLSVMPA